MAIPQYRMAMFQFFAIFCSILKVSFSSTYNVGKPNRFLVNLHIEKYNNSID